MDKRINALKHWLTQTCGFNVFGMQPLVGGASFRRYFRIVCEQKTWIAMDAPPDHENNHAFIAIDHAFAAIGLHVPHILKVEAALGFLLLEDLGDDLFFRILTPDNADHLYQKGLDALLLIQKIKEVPDWTLPHLDYEFMLNELYDFQTWYLERYLKKTISTEQQKILDQTFSSIARISSEQQQVCIHRDYHSQNLMRLANDNLGVLDFQSAMLGPITYDAASLLRDCYIAWPTAQVQNWVLSFHKKCLAAGAFVPKETKVFLRDFDFMALQRHLKAILTYARKKVRDSDNSYLQFIPCALNYVHETCRRYKELAAFYQLIQQCSPIREVIT